MNTFTSDLSRQAMTACRIKISQHAVRRAKERLRWNRNAIFRMASRALAIGLAPTDAAGSLKYFLLSKVSDGRSSCPFLYGENIYVFAYSAAENEVVLLTVYRAAYELIRALANQMRRCRAHRHFGVNIGSNQTCQAITP